jgi:IclR family transcriptional regulator, KDG regulon repressor
MKPTAIDKAFHLLDLLIEQPHGVTPAELSRQAGYPAGTLHRMLNTLVSSGYARKDAPSGRYLLGYKFVRGFRSIQSELRVHEKALPHLKKLALATGKSANLGTAQGGHAIFLESVHPDRSGPITSYPAGTRLPLHCTAIGKTMLAHLADGEARELIQSIALESRTPNTIVSPERLLAHLSEVRQKGYAIDDEEESYGWKCVAAPIRNHQGEVIAAVSVSAPAHEMPAERLATIADLVMQTAQTISGELGYEPESKTFS